MNRRAFVMQSGLVLLGGAFAGSRLASAQATPAAASLLAGYPELTITVTDDAMPTLPAAAAGWTALTIANAGTKELHFVGVKLPDDATLDSIMNDLATPTAQPSWLNFDALTSLCNPDWPKPGASATGLSDLQRGKWLLLDPIDGRAPSIWTITAPSASSAALVEPAAEVTVGLIEMDFTGLDAPVPAGKRLWKIENNGVTAHEFVIIPVAAGTTKEEIVAKAKLLDQGGTDFSWFQPVGGQGATGKGQTGFQVIDLAPGPYAALCNVPGSDGLSHASMGMVRIFTAQ
jgi:hypothetical protein